MRGSCVRLYTDSAYTSLKTFLYLKKHSIFSTGTCKKNTMGLHPSVRNAPTKLPRGSHRIFQDENDRFLTCCLWFDTKPVRFISTEADPTVIAFALHRIGLKYECVNQPSVTSNYANQYKSIRLFWQCRKQVFHLEAQLQTMALLVWVLHSSCNHKCLHTLCINKQTTMAKNILPIWFPTSA